MTDEKKFENFGYKTDKACDICGNIPAVIEPRFNYITCIIHASLSPIEFQELKNKK